uniref:Uncharacterized protein n=1 Tax=Tanacetum cinerariifolium TaxID=118510 RepID=A0A6L2JP05_TANCI|nr:hypothetical protein [Tanacetum cinerariifolium]
MESVKKLIDERAHHKREYESRVNERLMQTIEEKVDTSQALDASLVDKESSGTESKEQDTSSRSGNDTHVDDAYIRPMYYEEAMAETTSLIAKNDEFKAQLHDKGFAIAALKNELRKLTGNSVNTKFAKLSILGKPVLQTHRNQSVFRQPTAFKSERPRISKLWFASQFDVNNDLSKLVTTHYLPKEIESAVAKPNHMIASSNSRNSLNNMPRFSSTDMVHNHYLEEAKKKTQESSRNLEPSIMPSATLQIGLRWIPTGKIFNSSTTKVDIEPPNGSNADITNQYECEQTLDVSAGTLNLNAGTSFNLKKEGLKVCSELEIHDHSNEPCSSKLVPKVVPPVDKTATSRQELELLFHHHIIMLRMSTVKSTNGMSSLGQIRIARRRRISGRATTGVSGNLDDGVTTVDGAGKMGAVGISGVEVVVSDYESSEHRKGKTIGATDTGGGELSDGSASDDESVSSLSTPAGEATAAGPTFGATGTSTEIEPKMITREKEDPKLSTDTSKEIEITRDAISCTSKSLLKSPLYQTMQGACNAEEFKDGVKYNHGKINRIIIIEMYYN